MCVQTFAKCKNTSIITNILETGWFGTADKLFVQSKCTGLYRTVYSVHFEVMYTKSFHSELTSSGQALCQQSTEDKDSEYFDHSPNIMLSGLYVEFILLFLIID